MSGGPAFPNPGTYGCTSEGMSLRDYFAGQALGGLSVGHKFDPKTLASLAYARADAMLKARGIEDSDTVELREELRRANEMIAHYETLRPIWAKGFTSDGVAANVTASALTSIWQTLGVKNQTEAMEKLRELVAK